MNTHIVISRNKLDELLFDAFIAGSDDKIHNSPAYTLPSGWLPIADAPKDGTWVLVAGPSGYTTTPWRVEVGRYQPDYRNSWRNQANDAFTDGGTQPTHFLPLVTPE
jgi:hypothetical protein